MSIERFLGPGPMSPVEICARAQNVPEHAWELARIILECWEPAESLVLFPEERAELAIIIGEVRPAERASAPADIPPLLQLLGIMLAVGVVLGLIVGWQLWAT